MGKRTKQYRKLMRQFQLLGFREPYQLLLTSDVILDTIKLDLMHLFEKTLSCKNLKPMITQCSIRALYAKNVPPNKDPAVVAAIDRAKTFERRRCGHLMDQDPLPERECVMSCVDPKSKGENKFRYIVVTQDEFLRGRLRSVVPTPLMYVHRSVMILEPMSAATQQARDQQERAKLLGGIIRGNNKRKREDDSDDEGSKGEESGNEGDRASANGEEEKRKKKKKKRYGPKGPNPLAVKKPKKKQPPPPKKKDEPPPSQASGEKKSKRKRRKKQKSEGGGSSEGGHGQLQGETVHASGDGAQD